MSTVLTTQWVDEMDLSGEGGWTMETAKVFEQRTRWNLDEVLIERNSLDLQDGFYVLVWTGDDPHTPQEARELGLALLAAADEAELRSRA